MTKYVRILLIAAAMLLPAAAGAQLGNYFRASTTDWSSWSGKWINIPHTNDLLAASNGGSGSNDSRVSTVQNIGFTFPLRGVNYTQFSVNADGNLRLGSTVMVTGYYTMPFSSTKYNQNAPKINFFGCDGYWDSTRHYVCAYDTIDNRGNRLLVVEFCLGTFNTATRTQQYRWQVHLYPNGTIEVVFPSSIPTTKPAVARQMGLSDFHGALVVNADNSITHTVGGTDSAWASGTWPASCQVYTFAPAAQNINVITPTTSWNGYTGSISHSATGVGYPARFYPVQVEPGYTYRFNTGSCWQESDGPTAADFSAKIELFNAVGKRVDQDYAGCVRTDYTPAEAGTMYVKVSGQYSDDTGSFTLAYRKECTEYPNYTYEITPSTNIFKTHDSVTFGDCDHRVYRVPVERGYKYFFSTNRCLTAYATTALGDGAGTEIHDSGYGHSFDYVNCSMSNSLSNYTSEFYATQSGNIYVKVQAASTTSNMYTLSYIRQEIGTFIPNYDYAISPTTSWQTTNSFSLTNHQKLFRVAVSAGDTCFFRADANSFLVLYDSVGNKLASSTVGGEMSYRVPGEEEYLYLVANMAAAYLNTSPNVTFQYKKSCPTIPDYNYYIAADVSWQTHSESTIGKCDSRQIYSISLTKGKPYVFKTGGGDGATCNFDTYLELYDRNGIRKAYNDDNGSGGTWSLLRYTPDTSAAYYLVVRGYGSYSGNYTLAYRKECTLIPDYDYAIAPTTAWNTHSDSTVGTCNNERIYRVPVTAGHRYVFKTGCGNGATADFDTRIYLYNGSGNQLTYNDDACDRLSKLIYTATETGYYFLKVRGWGSYVGHYTLAYKDSIACTALTAADLPYTENFDGYTTSTTAKTGAQPPCWTLAHQYVTMTDEYKPMIYYKADYAHSGSYTLFLNYRGIYAMPEFDGDVSSLQLSFYLRQPQAKYRLQVGVMNSLSDDASFTPVATIDNTSTGVEPVSVDFSSYSGSGHFIAFKNILASGYSGNYSYNYIDDITLELRPTGCPAITAADLPYSDNFDTYTTSTTPKTGVQPPCWTLAHQYVTMSDEYKPTIYYKAESAHSGSYTLFLNYRGIYAMPEFDGDVSSLQLSFYLRQPHAKYRLQVGVMSDLGSESTFVPVATIGNSTTGVEPVTVDFSSYTGSGRYIAFRNALASGYSGNYSYNYIDDLTLSVAGSKSDGGIADNMVSAHSLNVYPNPTTGRLSVVADDEVLRIDVFDYTGRCVATFERQGDIDISRLAVGIYTLRVTLPERIEVRRVVKR